jgi:hypothetical protein
MSALVHLLHWCRFCTGALVALVLQPSNVQGVVIHTPRLLCDGDGTKLRKSIEGIQDRPSTVPGALGKPGHRRPTVSIAAQVVTDGKQDELLFAGQLGTEDEPCPFPIKQ